MFKMFRNIAIAAALLISSPVMAAAKLDCNTLQTSPVPTLIKGGWTFEEITKATTECANTNSPISISVTPDNANQWGQVAKEFAQAIGIAARELGVATNDFLGTPAGKLTAGLIFWKVAGDDVQPLMRDIIGFIFVPPLILGLWLAAWRVYRSQLDIKVTYTMAPTMFGLYQRRKVESYQQDGFINDGAAGIAMTALGVAVVGSLCLLGIMFN